MGRSTKQVKTSRMILEMGRSTKQVNLKPDNSQNEKIDETSKLKPDNSQMGRSTKQVNKGSSYRLQMYLSYTCTTYYLIRPILCDIRRIRT
jgi:hypothetical protein